MTRVAILPEPAAARGAAYRAIAGERQSTGSTAGEALDALAAQLPAEEASTLIVIRSLGADRFFTEQQQARLGDLMDRWRAAREAGASLPTGEQTELDGLVEAELRAAAARTGALADQMQP